MIHPHQEWNEVLAAFNIAAADLEHLGLEYADAELDFFGNVHSKALLAMAVAPVPDMAALVKKLEILIGGDFIEACGPYFRPALDAVLGDVRRLGGMVAP